MATIAYPVLVCAVGGVLHFTWPRGSSVGLVAFGAGLLVTLERLATANWHW